MEKKDNDQKIQRTHSNLGDRIRQILRFPAPRSRRDLFLSSTNLSSSSPSSSSPSCPAPSTALSRSHSSSYSGQPLSKHARCSSQPSPRVSRKSSMPCQCDITPGKLEARPSLPLPRPGHTSRINTAYRSSSDHQVAFKSLLVQHPDAAKHVPGLRPNQAYSRSLSQSNKSKTWNERTCLRSQLYDEKDTLYSSPKKGRSFLDLNKASLDNTDGGEANKVTKRNKTGAKNKSVHSRHSIHFDSVQHALSGLDTLDPPVRKKISWPLEPPVSQCLGCSVLLTDNNVCYGRTSPSRPPGKDTSSSKKDGSEDRTKTTQDDCSCRKDRHSKDSKYGKIYAENGQTSGDVYSEIGRKKPDSKEADGCPGIRSAESALPRLISSPSSAHQCCAVLQEEQCCSYSKVRQPHYTVEGPNLSSRGDIPVKVQKGQHRHCVEGPQSQYQYHSLYQAHPDDTSMEANSLRQLWTGVSGVPGLGVSVHVPTPPKSLQEWDNHASSNIWSKNSKLRQLGSTAPNTSNTSSYTSTSRNGDTSMKLELPRVLSPRSSSCQSSVRSSGSSLSQGVSSGGSSGGSGGGLSGGSTQSNRSDSLLSKHRPGDNPGKKQSINQSSQKSVQKSTNGCDCVCTCGGEGEEDPPTRTAGGNRRHRRVMFTDECNCDAWDEDEDEEKGWDDEGRGEGCSECEQQDLHYQSPKEVDGDYSYAYSDSVSPAFLIRINASLDYNETENIYEEINETKSEKTSGDSIRAIFRRAKDTVKRNSRNLDESSFHMSISKGRKQTLKERSNVDWDDDEDSGGLVDLKKTSKGLSSLKLDIEEIFQPVPVAPSSVPSGEDTQDDSGFHSGGQEEPNRRKKSKSLKNPKINRCESLDFIKPGQDVNGGVDGGGRVGGCGDQFKRRSAIIEHSQPQSLPVISSSNSRHPSPSLPPLPSLPTLPTLPPPPPQVRKKSYLSRFAILPFIKGNQQHPQQHPPQPVQQHLFNGYNAHTMYNSAHIFGPQQYSSQQQYNTQHYGANNNLEKYEKDPGRTFYL